MTDVARTFRRFTIDAEAQCFEVEMSDGVAFRHAVDPASEGPLPRDFRRMTYDAVERTLTMIVPSGEQLEVEVFDPNEHVDRRLGRPVVYLDQNKWILLARVVHSPTKAPPSEVAAATALIQLARDGRVVLPLSSGHLIETSRTNRTWRQHLGPLMVSLSRGWMMRDPILVRRAELVAMFQARGLGSAAVGNVFTLDPLQVFAEGIDVSPCEADLPEPFRRLTEILSTATALFAVLVEDEVTYSTAGYERAAAWADSYFDLAQELNSNSAARQRSRDVTRVRFLQDLGLDLAHSVADSGLPPEGFASWLANLAEDDIQRLPYLGRMRDVIHFRLRNPTDGWEPNDLVDMMYLPCAAAYADALVAEKKTVDYLRRANRSRTTGAKVVTSFADLVDHLTREDRSHSGLQRWQHLADTTKRRK